MLEVNGGTVVIPEGALLEDVEITFESVEVQDIVNVPDGYQVAGSIVILRPHGLEFAKPVDVQLDVKTSASPDELVVLWLEDDQDTKWETLAGVVFDNSRVRFQVDHFSTYGVFQIADEGAGTGGGSGGSALTAAGGMGTGGAIGSGGSLGTGGGGTCSDVASGSGSLVIDDFEHEGSSSIPEVAGRSGSWFVFNDGSVDGEQTPASGSEYPIEDTSSFIFASTATGFSTSGAGFGVTLNQIGDWTCAYDASGTKGVRFWGRSPIDSVVRVSLRMLAQTEVDSGGLCMAESCDVLSYSSVALSSEWSQYDLDWSIFAGGSEPTDPSELTEIVFRVPGGTYDIELDELAFY